MLQARLPAERRALQASGALSGSHEQQRVGHVQAFIDDESGSTSDDPVPMPSSVNTADPTLPYFIDVAAFLAITAEEGGRPAEAGTRVVAHCCLCIDTALRLNLEVAPKTLCGDGIVVLGLRVDAEADRLDCPPAKSAVMVEELGQLRRETLSAAAMERDMVERDHGPSAAR